MKYYVYFKEIDLFLVKKGTKNNYIGALNKTKYITFFYICKNKLILKLIFVHTTLNNINRE